MKEAERQAAHIIREAESKSAALLTKAKKEAEQVLAAAEQKAAQAVERGEAALKQAGRDLLLKTREMVVRLFDGLLRKELKTALEGKLLEELVVRAVSDFQGSGGQGVELQVSAGDVKRLEKYLRAAFSGEVGKGIVITPVDAIDAGFRIGEKDGTVFHDITDSGLAEILGAFVNPGLAAIIGEAAGDKDGHP